MISRPFAPGFDDFLFYRFRCNFCVLYTVLVIFIVILLLRGLLIDRYTAILIDEYVIVAVFNSSLLHRYYEFVYNIFAIAV